jgi:MFS family permease
VKNNYFNRRLNLACFLQGCCNLVSGKHVNLFVAVFSSVAFLFSTQSIPPLLPTLIGEFGLTHTSASSLVWLAALPGVFLSILGGLLTGRFGVKRLAVLGAAIMTAGSLLCSTAGSVVFLQFSRFFLGIGGAMVLVSAPVLICEWFGERELGSAMGFYGLNMPVGTIAAFIILGFVSQKLGWRTSLLVTSVVDALALLCCVLFLKEKKSVSKQSTGGFSVHLRNSGIWILGLIWCLFNMAQIGYSTWGKTIFLTYGLSAGSSDLVASLLIAGSLATPLTGFISDRWAGHRTFFIVIAAVSMTAMFPLFPYVGVSSVGYLALILGLLAAFLPPAVFALPETILGAGNESVGWGVLNTFQNSAIIIGPLSAGYALDVLGSTSPIFFLFAFFALLSSILAILLRSRIAKVLERHR